jgi:phosphoribosylformylglycinamidine synthase
MKVETHNHPTAISPFPGAATGAGGEIRDEGATGRGSQPKAGLTGFAVSNLRLPWTDEPWEREARRRAGHLATPLDIMLDGADRGGGVQQRVRAAGTRWVLPRLRADRRRRAPGLSQADHERRRIGDDRRRPDRQDCLPRGTLLVQLGGPGMRIGMGGGAASSMAAGTNAAAPGLRLGAAWQPGDGAARPGGHQPLLVTRRRQPDPGDPRRGGGRAVQRLPRTRRRRRASAPGSNSSASRWTRAASRRRSSGPTRARSATSWPSPPRISRGSPGWPSGSAARMPLSDRPFDDGMLRLSFDTEGEPGEEFAVDMPMEVLLGKPPRMTRDVTGSPGRATTSTPGGVDEVRDAAYAVLAPPERREQAVPDHHRRPDGRRADPSRPDGRALAGPGRRRRGDPGRPRRLRGRGDGHG